MGRPAAQLIVALAVLFCCVPVSLVAQPAGVTIVYSSESGPYSDALEGLRSNMGSTPLKLVDLKSPDSLLGLVNSLQRGSSRLLITIGSEALDVVSSRKADVPVLATMIMRSEQARVQYLSAALHLDIPVTDILAELKTMFPDKTRLLIIRNPALPDYIDATALARARQQGFQIQIADCNTPDELVRVLRSSKGQVDFVLCRPDSTLYNGTTVKPVVLASLESRLLIVGFSQSFVRAGAALGVYPDFHDVGVQTAQMALKQLSGQTGVVEEAPRKVVVAVNQRIMRLLGVDYQPRRAGDLLTLR